MKDKYLYFHLYTETRCQSHSSHRPNIARCSQLVQLHARLVDFLTNTCSAHTLETVKMNTFYGYLSSMVTCRLWFAYSEIIALKTATFVLCFKINKFHSVIRRIIKSWQQACDWLSSAVLNFTASPRHLHTFHSSVISCCAEFCKS